MASIIKKKTKYSTYYVIAESARVDGKPRIVKQWYLGTIDKVIALAEGHPFGEEIREVDCVEEGCIAALMKIANELGIKSIVNAHCDKRKQGMSVGDYVLIAALNRAIAATSKNKIREWVDGTALHLYMRLERDKLDSQNFWDHFDKLTTEDVQAIGDKVARKAVEIEKIQLDCLVYDTTNYYNYWDVTNSSSLAKMTKSKAGKNNLRHIGLAIAVDRDHGLPLFFRLYPANSHDSTVIKSFIDSIFEQISATISDKKSVTFVFDKGNNSEDLFKKLDETRHHFVGTRSPYHHKDLCKIALDDFKDIKLPGRVDSIKAFETTSDLYGADRRVFVTYNDSAYRRQLARLERHLDQAKRELSFFKRKAKEADGRSTIESIERHAREIADQFHVTGYLDIEVEEQAEGYKVSARRNFPAIEEAKLRFGKQIIFTNRMTISAADVISFYRGRNIVEEAFRITKSDRWVKMDPAFHWTDSKINVHALTCMLALMMVRIAHKRVCAKGFTNSAERMMELLAGVKTAMVFHGKSSKPQRILCKISEDQNVLLTNLECKIPERR